MSKGETLRKGIDINRQSEFIWEEHREEKRRLDGVWRDKGQNGIFFATRKSFHLQMSAENGEVMGYRELERGKG